MTFNMCTNLYVKDVAVNAEFFLAIGFTELSRQNIMDYETVVLAPEAGGNARLQLFDIEFIRQMSPEVADDKPSILFTVSNIEEMHAKVAAQGFFTNTISDMGGKKTFNFASPDGMYFAFMES